MAEKSEWPIRVIGVECITPGREALNKVTFLVNRGLPEYNIEIPVLVPRTFDDADTVRVARNWLHHICRQIAEQTSDWHISTEEFDALQPKQEGRS